MPPLLQALTAPPFQHLAPTALLQAIWQRNNPVGLHPQLGLILGCSQWAGQLTAPHPQWGGGGEAQTARTWCTQCQILFNGPDWDTKEDSQE